MTDKSEVEPDPAAGIKLGTCEICLDEIEHKSNDDHLDSAFVPVALNCGHLFHAGCLHNWIHKYTKVWTRQCIFNLKKIQPLPDSTCPICRTEIKSNISRLILNDEKPPEPKTRGAIPITDEERIEMLDARINHLKQQKNAIVQRKEAEQMDRESRKQLERQRRSDQAKRQALKRRQSLKSRAKAKKQKSALSINLTHRRSRSLRGGNSASTSACSVDLPTMVTGPLAPAVSSVFNLRRVPSRLAARAAERDSCNAQKSCGNSPVSRQNYYYDEEFTPSFAKGRSQKLHRSREKSNNATRLGLRLRTRSGGSGETAIASKRVLRSQR